MELQHIVAGKHSLSRSAGRRLRIGLLGLLSCIGCYNAKAVAAPTQDDPLLRIETGNHTAVMRQISIDQNNSILVTGSEDKTVRVWDIASGQLLKILRPPIAMGAEGQIDAVALSPDGKTVACGGWTGIPWGGAYVVYVFDQVTGRLVRRIPSLPSNVTRLLFSKDGKYLVVGLAKGGIRIYRTSDYLLMKSDKDYTDRVYGLDFDSTGRLVASCVDGYLHLYNADLAPLAKVRTRNDHKPYAVSFSPDGQKIAVGFADARDVEVVSGLDLAFQYAPPGGSADNGSLGCVAWSKDGHQLYAGGSYQKDGVDPILKWSDDAKATPVELTAATNTILDILPLSGGGIIYASADPGVGIFDGNDKRLSFQNAALADMRDVDLRLSADGSTVGYSFLPDNQAPALFSITKRFVSINSYGKPEWNQLQSAATAAPWLSIEGLKDGKTPKIQGVPVQLENFDRARCISVNSDRAVALLGTNWSLHLLGRDGKLLWRVSAPATVWGVNIAPDGKVAAAALGDGTIRWYNLADGSELLAFYSQRERVRLGNQESWRIGWVVWTPSGYYDAAPGAEDLVGWHVNRGGELAADFFPVARFREGRYRPGIIGRVLAALGEAEALRLARLEDEEKQKMRLAEIEQQERDQKDQQVEKARQDEKLKTLEAERLAQAEQIKQQEARFQTIQEQLKTLAAEKQAQDARIRELEAARTEQSEALKAAQAQRKEQDRKLSDAQEALRKQTEQLQQLQQQRETQGKQIEQQEAARQRQEGEIGDLKKLLQQQDTAIKQKQTDIAHAKSDEEERRLRAELEKLTKAHNSATTALRAQIIDLQAKQKELNALLVQKRAADERLALLQAQLKQQDSAFHALQQAHTEQEEKLKQQTAKLLEQETELNKLKQSSGAQNADVVRQQQAYQKLQGDLKVQAAELQKKDEAVKAAKVTAGALETRVQQLEQEVAVFKKSEKERQELARQREEKEKKRIAEIAPPVVTIVSPVNGTTVKDSKITIRYTVRTPSGEPVKSIVPTLDGRPQGTRDLVIATDDPQDEKFEELTIQIPQRDCVIGIVVSNGKGLDSAEASVRLHWGLSPKVVHRNLYVLAVGVSEYKDTSINLRYADQDATTFADMMRRQEGICYEKVEKKLLANKDATRENIIDALDWISRQPKSPEDVAMIFLSGHGINTDGDTFYFVPHDANRSSEGKIKSSCLSYTDITNTVKNVVGKAIVFLDTCHAGNLTAGTGRRDSDQDIHSAINVLTSSKYGSMVFASSTGNQQSLEDPQVRHGLFTLALTEAIADRRACYVANRITMTSLELYVTNRVAELSEGRQTPTLTKPANVPDFDVALG